MKSLFSPMRTSGSPTRKSRPLPKRRRPASGICELSLKRVISKQLKRWVVRSRVIQIIRILRNSYRPLILALKPRHWELCKTITEVWTSQSALRRSADVMIAVSGAGGSSSPGPTGQLCSRSASSWLRRRLQVVSGGSRTQRY